jgi:DNA-binding LacI/PurR family transcriptional regulator
MSFTPSSGIQPEKPWATTQNPQESFSLLELPVMTKSRFPERYRVDKVRITDIAKALGVSPAAVSYALSDTGRMSKETRKRIVETAKNMGYIRNDNASRLRTGRSALIGVILNTVKNPFFSELAAALEMAAYDGGYLTLLATAQNDPVRQKELLHSMISQGVGGIILSPVHESSHDLLEETTRRKIPTVVCVRDLPDQKRVFVGADEEMSGHLAASHLIANGHRTMTFLGGYDSTSTWTGRKRGVLRALADVGLSADACEFRPGSLLPEFAFQDLMQVHAAGTMPRAIMCFNDDQCGGAYRAARQLGLTIGGDLSIVGFDNIPQGETLSPGLTTVDIYPAEIGRRSALRLQEMMKLGQHDFAPIILDPVLVERGSVARMV